MTYREQIKECLSKGREHLELAEKNTGLGKRVEERMHYRLACSYLIDAMCAYNEVIKLMAHVDIETDEMEDTVPDAPDYN